MLAAVVGLAGGITRDLLIGMPPATFRDWRYLAAAGAAGLVCFFAGAGAGAHRSAACWSSTRSGWLCSASPAPARRWTSALGPVQAIMLGAITGIGGGMLRDVLLRDVPTVLRHELYAIPALLGAGVRRRRADERQRQPACSRCSAPPCASPCGSSACSTGSTSRSRPANVKDHPRE